MRLALSILHFLGGEAGAAPAGTEGLSEPGLPERYLVRRWTTQHGLPQNTVTCLEQTPDGYLWMGTRYGLVRHDGLQPSVFLAELDQVATDAVDVRQLAADLDGTLWILTRRGLFRHAGGRWDELPLTAPGSTQPLRIEAIAQAAGGGVYLAGPAGVHRWRAGRLEPWFGRDRGFGGESVAELFEDRRGRLWVQVVQAMGRPWIRFDPASGELRSLREVMGAGWPEAELRHGHAWEAVHETRRGRLWAASPQEWRVTDENGIVQRGPAAQWAGRNVRGLREDGDGHVWMVTEGEVSLFRFDGRGFQPMQRIGGTQIPSDLRAMRVDREGHLWLGSGNAGVYRLQPRPLLARLPTPDLTREEVFSVAPGRDGVAWLGTLRGLIRLEGDRATVHTGRDDPAGPRCKPVLEDRQGRVWTGVFGGGLARLENARVQAVDVLSPGRSIHWQVRCLFEDAAGTVWAGTDVGLLRMGNGNPTWITRQDGLPAPVVLALAQTPDGALWVGTDGGGLGRLDQGAWRIYRTRDGLLHDRAWPLTVEPDGTLWVGTPLGLNRIRSGRIDAVTPRQGLPEDLAYSLLDDGRGWYWSHGNHGLSRVRKHQLHAVADGREPHVFCVAYDEADGMESTEGNGDEQPSAARLPNGELWFPTTRGVVVVDPSRLRDPETRPLTVVERIAARGRELMGREHPPARATTDPAARPVRIQVPPASRGLVEFHYTSPSFGDAERTRFRYRLTGLEDTWNEAGTRRVAYYTGLAPGQYRFEVLAGNRFGVWSEHPAVVDLVVEPRFRETRTFQALVGLAAGSVLLAVHRRRIRYRRRIEELSRRQALDAERSRIARDLHDELGAGLSAVAIKTEFAKGLAREGREIRPLLEQVGQSARDLVARVRETVWALNPSCDSLENLASFLAEWVEDCLEHTPMACRISVPAELPALPMSAESRHGLVLAVKEAVTNAVRHSQASELRFALRLEASPRALVLEIEDDGTGFPVPAPAPVDASPTAGPRGGSGLGNLRLRMASLGGRGEIDSSPGRGTRVTLRLPLAPPSRP